VLVINKMTDALETRLAIQGTATGATARVYRWTGSGIARDADATVSAGGIDASFPARSMTLFVVDTLAPATSLLPTLPAVPAVPTPATTAAAPSSARHTSRRKGRRHRIIAQSPRAGRTLRQGAPVAVVVRR
jgi:hypothetical protein